MENENGHDYMLERGVFEANGYKFVVTPVYLGEETDYMMDVSYALYPHTKEGEELTDKDLSRYAIALFRFNPDEIQPEKLGLFGKIKLMLVKAFNKDYRYYSYNPSILGLIKWVEKKVYYKGRRIKFYQLERKFGLNKSEIIKLLGYFQELSGF